MNDDQREALAEDILDALTPLIDRWLTEALTSGPLPDGWRREEEWGNEDLGRTDYRSYSWIDEEALQQAGLKRRTVIRETGWRQADE